MTDTYAAAKEQLDDIVTQVRKKDVSLEKSLDLLEEGVLLANRCTELIDQAAWDDMPDEEADDLSGGNGAADQGTVADVAEDMTAELPATVTTDVSTGTTEAVQPKDAGTEE